MLIDARTLDKGATLQTGVCVVGSGAAGISLALQFIGKGVPVTVLESGGLTTDDRTQSLAQARCDGTILGTGWWPRGYTEDPREGYLGGSRARCLGGTTSLWGGWCRPFDALDFEERDWVPHSGWPISRADLDPYYKRAAPLFQIQPFEDAPYHRGTARRPALASPESDLRSLVVHFSPPTRFGEVYRDALAKADDVRVLTHANLVDLESDALASRVTRAKVATLEGNTFWVEAPYYVLATGGVENARLLLLANKVQEAGLGNANGLVGRFFMDHAYVTPGQLLALVSPEESGLYQAEHEEALGHRTLGVICLSAEAQRRHRLRHLWLGWGSPSHLQDYPPTALDADVGRAVTAYTKERGFRPRLLTFSGAPECSPNPDSRVTLAQECDALGCRRAKVDWRVLDADSDSVRRSVGLIARELARLSAGRVRVLVTPEDPFPRGWGGTHHSGTTRMSRDPRKGVVNPDCRLHQVANLYAVGSSVFPTLGAANPTFTIVALALRLADHLLRALQR
jgi:choline dehydrogenase-like flavoprotein